MVKSMKLKGISLLPHREDMKKGGGVAPPFSSDLCGRSAALLGGLIFSQMNANPYQDPKNAMKKLFVSLILISTSAKPIFFLGWARPRGGVDFARRISNTQGRKIELGR